MTVIIKRDGRSEEFDGNKIIKAIKSAGLESTEEQVEVVHKVESKLTESMNIQDIHSAVEDALMEINHEAARKYIEYRSERDRQRLAGSSLGESIKGLVQQTGDIVTENANKSAKLISTQRDLLAGIIAKQFARDFVLPKHITKAHEDGDIHYHDLDYSPFQPMTNCCLVDLKGMLSNGFRMGNAQIDTPKSIGVAATVTCQVIAQVACAQYGGTTIANLDQVLAPYVRMSYDKHMVIAREFGIQEAERYAKERTEKDTYDAMQSIEYEVNTLYTTGGQAPFCTVSFGMGTSWESRLIQQSILKVRLKGIGKSETTAIFPKLVMFVEEGINLKPEDPNYDIKQLALECAAKRLYPDIISAKINRKITGSSVPVSPMGKHTTAHVKSI